MVCILRQLDMNSWVRCFRKIFQLYGHAYATSRDLEVVRVNESEGLLTTLNLAESTGGSSRFSMAGPSPNASPHQSDTFVLLLTSLAGLTETDIVLEPREDLPPLRYK
jgi:hypothetical protein